MNVKKSEIPQRATKPSVKTEKKVATFQKKQPRFVPEDLSSGQSSKTRSNSPTNNNQSGNQSRGYQQQNRYHQDGNRNFQNHPRNFQNQSKNSGGNSHV